MSDRPAQPPSIWRQHDFPDLAAALATRPGHEAVRTMVADILRQRVRRRLPGTRPRGAAAGEVHGRADALFGATVIEIKSDLRGGMATTWLARLPDYLREREPPCERRFLGIATDGATFVAYELRDGAMAEIPATRRADRPEALLAWLEPALAERDDLAPDSADCATQAWPRKPDLRARPRRAGTAVGRRCATHPEAALKRRLWDGLLREVYGTRGGR